MTFHGGFLKELLSSKLSLKFVNVVKECFQTMFHYTNHEDPVIESQKKK